MDKIALREIVKNKLDSIVADINLALSGKTIKRYEETLTRIGRGGKIPHWYEHLAMSHVLPNLDGKIIWSYESRHGT